MATPVKKKTSTISKTTTPAAASREALPSTSVENSVRGLKYSILNRLKHTLARDPESATKRDWWIATAYAARDHVLERMIDTQAVHHGQNVRRLYYFSLEYLMGRLLVNK